MKNSLLFPLFCSMFPFLGFGQEKLTVEPAFSILSEFDKVRDFTMNQSGTEAYFTIQSPTEEVSVISSIKKVGETWKLSGIASFSGKHKDLEPFLAPNELRLYFVSNRPLQDSVKESKDFDIWYVERGNFEQEWSSPINLGNPINTENNEFYPSVSENGNLYFTSDSPQGMGKDDIFFSRYMDDGFSIPVPLSESINSEGFEYNSYISKNEKYLIFGGYNRADGQGSGDLYISYNVEGEWTEAKPLAPGINSKYMDYCPFMDEANNVLYFTSRRSTNPGNRMETMEDLRDFLNSYENGNSRLYKSVLKIKPPK